MDAVQILKEARALIADEKKWTQGEYSRINGKGVGHRYCEKLPVGSECFCAIGSLAWSGNLTLREAESSDAYKILAGVIADHGGEVHIFNDISTHAEVLDLFDRAIARAESEAA